MPNPVPLANKEEEARRAWVTTHHEVVRLIKDCFGDRFSNNEIFDRLKISRRTGYRALGNDDRIGKAAGRKPKITETTVREMIEYIESGNARDVGNVWKHLAQKFAPDCNPKTVQDAIKKSGFKNYNNSVKLEPLLNQPLPENSPTPLDDDGGLDELTTDSQTNNNQPDYSPAVQEQSQSNHHSNDDVPQHTPYQPQSQSQQHQHNVIDPVFQSAQNSHDVLRQYIETVDPTYIRQCLQDIVLRFPEASYQAMGMLCPWLLPSQPIQPSMPTPTMAQLFSQSLSSATQNTYQSALDDPSTNSQANDQPNNSLSNAPKQKRMAKCRRCGETFDRAENSMENRSCSYHKGSHQKISPNTTGTIEEAPEAYIWSCCGGNGMVRGCTRAMHTTKKKRTYKKRRASAGDGGGDMDDEGVTEDDDDMEQLPEKRLKIDDADGSDLVKSFLSDDGHHQSQPSSHMVNQSSGIERRVSHQDGRDNPQQHEHEHEHEHEHHPRHDHTPVTVPAALPVDVSTGDNHPKQMMTDEQIRQLANS